MEEHVSYSSVLNHLFPPCQDPKVGYLWMKGLFTCLQQCLKETEEDKLPEMMTDMAIHSVHRQDFLSILDEGQRGVRELSERALLLSLSFGSSCLLNVDCP